MTDPWLDERGFPLQAVLDVAALPEWVGAPLRDAGLDIYHFDDYSVAVAGEYADRLGADHEVVYPADVLLPLGRMAERAGWGRPSPLGLTINDRFGLWLAHRVVFLIDAALPLDTGASNHPCATCVDTPCVTACPVGAVSTETSFDVDTCSRFRITPDSPCADRCLARLACPIGTGYRYPDEQMQHHYRAGLDSIRRFYEG
jgi:hypothetical protein